MRCCARDEGVALRSRSAGGGSKPPRAALAEDRRGERRGKAQVMRQVGIRKTVRSLEVEIAVEVSLPKSRGHQNRDVCGLSRDEPGGCPLIGRVVSGT